MEIKTFADLIEWTRLWHLHLSDCLNGCAVKHQDERAKMLLGYIAGHELEIGQIVTEFEKQANANTLNTRVYDYVDHKPVKFHQSCDGHYSNLTPDQICREIFEFHDQVIALYDNLSGKAEIVEAKELADALLAMEQHEAKRLATQIGRIDEG